MKDIKILRKEIDQIDQQLFKLIKKRLEIVKVVGVYKKAHQLPIKDPLREKQILNEKSQLAKQMGISPEFIKKIWKLFFKESYKAEE